MIYDHENYKSVLKTVLLQKRDTVSKTFTFQNMAKACRVQKTYLSRVFNGDAHLNDDQLYLACEYLGFTEDERQYLSLLHQYERSCVQGKKRTLQRRIDGVKKRHLMTDSHLKAQAVPAVEAQDFAAYYLDPNMQLVHMYLTVPKYAGNLAALRAQLGLPEAELTRLLTKLQQLGIVAFEGGRYVLTLSNLHLPPDSPVYKPYRTLLRMKSMERLGALRSEEPYNFSVLFSANEETRKRIQARFLEFLKDVEDEVKAAPEEDVYHLSFDLFRWSTG